MDRTGQGRPTAEWWAHTPNRSGRPHPLVEHLEGTAQLAGQFGAAFGCADLGAQVGLVHDLGKAGGCFQDYLRTCWEQGDAEGRRRFPVRDHKTAGARLLWAPSTAGILGALAVSGHHGGLPKFADLRDKMSKLGPDAVVPLAVSVLGDRWDARAHASVPAWAEQLSETTLHDVEMLGRFVQSALADADYLDTAAHFGRQEAPVAPSMVDLAHRVEAGHDALSRRATRTTLNTARNEAYAEALAHAGDPPGWYLLPGVTGIGKTVIGLSWALHHAERHGLRQVVTAVPYITVTSQTAEAYRAVLDVSGDDRAVLEHHSRVEWAGPWSKLAAENWDAPVVVTTTVRLFESLFARRPSDVRRLHRLARSVVVLDEAQTLPVRLLDSLYDGLRCLVERFGASVLVMSATPPAIERVPTVAGRKPEAVLVDPYRWPVLKERVSWSGPVRVDHAGVARIVDAEESVLAICNTARDAAEVAKLCRRPLVYLARTLRPADVVERLGTVRRALAAGQPCRVVATQLVEAGVDLDFPVVVRVLGPAPSLEQAAGRCNREGLRAGGGRAVVVDLAGGRLPLDAAYAVGEPVTRGLLADGAAPLGDPALSRLWFERLLADPAASTDRDGVQQARASFDYPLVDRMVSLVDDEGVAVVVPWADDDERAPALQAVIEAARSGRPLDEMAARRLQDVTVNLRPWLAEQARRLGHLPADPSVLQVWGGPYDPVVGLEPAGSSVESKEMVW